MDPQERRRGAAQRCCRDGAAVKSRLPDLVCDDEWPDWALQDPGDYTDALGAAVRAAIRESGVDPGQVTGIATDFTASTCMPVLTDGTPLCQLPDLAARPHAYPKLWKHHAAQPQADRINALRSEEHTS